jgi:hypothetical protein
MRSKPFAPLDIGERARVLEEEFSRRLSDERGALATYLLSRVLKEMGYRGMPVDVLGAREALERVAYVVDLRGRLWRYRGPLDGATSKRGKKYRYVAFEVVPR